MLTKCSYYVDGALVNEYGFPAHTLRIYNFWSDQQELHPDYVEEIRLLVLPFSFKTLWKCLIRKTEITFY